MKKNTLNKALYSYHRRLSSYVKLFAICCGLFIVSCKAKKQVVILKPVKTDSTSTTVNATELKLNAIRTGQTYFNTFSGKARTKLDISGNSNDVTLNIRINRDKKIWVSITAIAGIEVARALITPDSIMVINRLQGVYIKQPFSYINKFTGGGVNYKTIESLLVGNAIPELVNDNASLLTVNDTTTLTGNLQALAYTLKVGPGMKVTQTKLSNQGAGQSLSVNNGVFMQAGSKIIPSQIDIASALKDKKILINFHYVKIDIDQVLEYPFSIPSRYEQGN